MKIRLAEIPAEGRKFSFNRQTGELNSALTDILDEAPYRVELLIRPLGNAFEMEGRVVTSMKEVCSLCGWDLSLPINKDFREILIDEPEAGRDTHHVHGNQSVDFLKEGPSTTPVRDGLFDAAVFVHEFVALAEPLYPSCGDPDCEHLEEAKQKQAELAAEFERADENTSPFASLEKIKDALKPKKKH